ncbi:MAG: hypothetical protein VXV91_06735, partial [Verrucomicrobiota bacterium]|nr:hypothetical protein [Verrucomicrobiota bacterium]MEC7236218.1 hypothetical protein [Verrucomicrobiota bacterium]
ISENKGFRLEAPFALPETRKVVDNARELFSQVDLDQVKIEAKKDYLLEIPIQSALTFNSPIIRLALEPSILKAVSHYMGMLPLLTQVRLWHSPNEHIIEGGSQFFHLDYADVRQVKIFVFIEEVTRDSGPLTVIPADASASICNSINYKLSNKDIRVDDEMVYRIAGEENVQPIVGPAGTLAFVDTCRCFHLGSRKANQPRTVLMIQYLSPFAFALPWNYKDGARYSHLAQNSMPDYIRCALGAI